MPQKPLDLSSGLKRCPQCVVTKPLSEFYKSKHTMHGYQVYCKPCMHIRTEVYVRHSPEALAARAERARKWRKDNPQRQLDNELRARYGMEKGTYVRMLAAQNSSCAICETDKPGGRGRFHIDHCHETGAIRGLLCANCNVGIGHFRHRIDLLDKAKSYLLAERSGER